MRYFVILLSLFTLYACNGVEFAHLDAKVDNKATFGDGSDDLGIEGVMPTIGKIYIDGVNVEQDDGGESDMLKAHLTYTLTADLIYDNYSMIENTGSFVPQCEWSSTDKGITFTGGGTPYGTDSYRTNLVKQGENYECDPVIVDFKKNGTDVNYDPDSLVTVSYLDNTGAYITAAGSTVKFTSRINLNTADRHNIISVATSPTTVLFHRKDGLFQAGYTAYRGALDLQQYIGSAMYEARVLAPGATDNVTNTKGDYTSEELAADKARMDKWLNSVDIDENSGIYSKSAFVASYGPPIALPAFTKNELNINYKRLRIALLRHNNNPIIISSNKKMYSMGTVTNFNSLELAQDYKYFIRANDNWFAYSGVKVENSADLYSKIHVGEIKPIDGTPAKFVTALSITSDLDTTIALNETDKEYYIAGNPHWNDNFCAEAATYDETTTGFTYNYPCMYSAGKEVGARKIVGLQRKLGDGTAAIITDSEIFYIGRDGKGYKIDIRPDGINGDNIRTGEPVVSELITWNDKVAESDRVENADNLYAIDMAYANMNHAVLPTLLLKDGSIVFTIRQVEGTGADVKVTNVARRFFINKNGIDVNKPGHPDNVRMVKLLGPSSAYGEDGNIYYFTDVPALGVSYAPNSQVADKDYLAFVYGDPIQFLGDIASDAEKQQFFKLTYGKIDIDAAIQRIEGDPSKSLNGNFAFLPYNPLTGQVENILETGDGSYTLQTISYRPFRTNSHLFVNMNKNADKSYISVPYYFYGFNSDDKITPSTWNYKKDGLMAAEVKHNNISKVFGTLKTPEIPFRYTPYGRNTTFFANKVGIFSFVDYNVRMTKSICQDTGDGTGSQKCDAGSLNGDASLADSSTNFPDYFYVAKSGQYAEEASGVNNYISTPIVKESRMTNYPNTQNYANNGFEPQLLSSWFNYEFKEVPLNPSTILLSDQKLFAAYPLSYWYDSISNRYTNDKTTYFKNNLNEFLGNTGGTGKAVNFYQYAYGVGEYRYYSANSYPVWRARKLNTEVLPFQTRYGTLIPMSHGQAFGEISSMLVTMFNMTTKLAESGKDDTENYVANRKYVTGLYGFYDRDAMQSGSDLGANVFGSIINPLDNMTTNKIGYIADTGIYMWRKDPNSVNSPINTTDANGGRFRLNSIPFANYYE